MNYAFSIMHSLVISSEAVYGGVGRSQTNHHYEFLIMNYELIRTSVRSALCSCFSLAPSSDAALSFLREAYTEPENAPRPARTADVCYWSLSPDYGADPASYGAEAAASGSHTPAVQRFLPFRLLLVCYGPGAEANAEKYLADEAARIQTFPDSHVFFGTRQEQCIQVGNAVPPRMAKPFFVQIAKCLKHAEMELSHGT